MTNENHNLLIQLENLKQSVDGDDRALIEEWERTVSNQEAYEALMENPLIKARSRRFLSLLESIDRRLSNERTLSDEERRYLFAQKDVVKLEFIDHTRGFGEMVGIIREKVADFVRTKTRLRGAGNN